MDKWFAPNAGPVTVKRIKIDAASAAAAGNELIAAVAGKRIYVLSAFLMAAAPVDGTFFSDPADTGDALTGALTLGAGGGFAWPFPPPPGPGPARDRRRRIPEPVTVIGRPGLGLDRLLRRLTPFWHKWQDRRIDDMRSKSDGP